MCEDRRPIKRDQSELPVRPAVRLPSLQHRVVDSRFQLITIIQ